MEKSANNINLLIADVSRTSISEQRIINRLFLSSNKILKNLFGSEISIIGKKKILLFIELKFEIILKINSLAGAAYNNVLLPNECVEATQFLTSKDLKQWSVEACHAINLVIIILLYSLYMHAFLNQDCFIYRNQQNHLLNPMMEMISQWILSSYP